MQRFQRTRLSTRSMHRSRLLTLPFQSEAFVVVLSKISSSTRIATHQGNRLSVNFSLSTVAHSSHEELLRVRRFSNSRPLAIRARPPVSNRNGSNPDQPERLSLFQQISPTIRRTQSTLFGSPSGDHFVIPVEQDFGNG